MHSSLKDFRRFGIFAGMVWMALFLFIGWKFSRVTGDRYQHTTYAVQLDRKTQSSWPVLLVQRSDAVVSDDDLPGPIRAEYFSREGGRLLCDHAILEIPKDATARGAYFMLESVSRTGLAYELTHTAKDLAVAPILRVYFGDQGEQPADLEMFHEITQGVYVRVPSRVDRANQCIIAEATLPGRYVVG